MRFSLRIKTDVDFAHIPHGLWKTAEDSTKAHARSQSMVGQCRIPRRGDTTHRAFCASSFKKGFQTLCGDEVAYPPI